MRYSFSFFIFLFVFFSSCQKKQKEVGGLQNDAAILADSLANKETDISLLVDLFEPCSTSSPIHFYSILDPSRLEEYPYLGRQIPSDLIGHHLVVPSLNDYQYGPWGVYALCQSGSLFFLRVPGKDSAKEIALFRKTQQGLKYDFLVAGSTCNGGYCTQTDSWLLDLNGDSLLDVVSRSLQQDPDKVVLSDQIIARIQQADGSFQVSSSIVPDKNIYILKKK